MGGEARTGRSLPGYFATGLRAVSGIRTRVLTQEELTRKELFQAGPSLGPVGDSRPKI